MQNRTLNDWDLIEGAMQEIAFTCSMLATAFFDMADMTAEEEMDTAVAHLEQAIDLFAKARERVRRVMPDGLKP